MHIKEIFDFINYPDGQFSLKFKEGSDLLGDINTLVAPFNNYKDLLAIVKAKQIFDYKGMKDGSLFIPCFLGQRSDRRFSVNQSFDLKVYCDVINSCNFSDVAVLDPHSDVLPALINNCTVYSSFPYVDTTIQNLNKENLVLISPDAGAYKKVFKYGENFGLPVVAANKYRDLNGAIDLVFIGDVKGKDCLIVDDYCDGGRTFLLLAAKLREQGANKVYLYVSHGLFSAGFKDFFGLIDHIFCTNSIKDIEDGDAGGWPMKKPEFLTQYKLY